MNRPDYLMHQTQQGREIRYDHNDPYMAHTKNRGVRRNGDNQLSSGKCADTQGLMELESTIDELGQKRTGKSARPHRDRTFFHCRCGYPGVG